jgi:surface antigen
MFAIRKTKPEAGNKFYNNGNNGGYSWCINGNPTDKGCNVLANCVGYACGRFNEIIGSMKYKTLCCNAENFIERAKEAGLEVVNYPVLGGIMVMQKGATLSGNDGAGHVFIVEDIYSDGSIYTSESGYGGSAFWNSRRYNTNGRWGHGSGYSFRGCIVNPAVGKVTTREENKPTPSPSTGKFKIGDKVILNGTLYTSSTGDTKGKTVKDKVTNITRYAAGAKHPYNTTGDLGWMNESDISLYSEPKKESFKTGDIVVPIKLVDYNGRNLVQYDKNYVITELKGDRAVLAANRNGKLYTWAALNTNNIKKA